MTTIDLTPEGMRTPEGCKRVAEAQAKLENAQCACARLLSEIVDEGFGYCNERKEEARDTVKAWKDATEEFLRAVCGR
jgi:hypothetical protein